MTRPILGLLLLIIALLSSAIVLLYSSSESEKNISIEENLIKEESERIPPFEQMIENARNPTYYRGYMVYGKIIITKHASGPNGYVYELDCNFTHEYGKRSVYDCVDGNRHYAYHVEYNYTDQFKEEICIYPKTNVSYQRCYETYSTFAFYNPDDPLYKDTIYIFPEDIISKSGYEVISGNLEILGVREAYCYDLNTPSPPAAFLNVCFDKETEIISYYRIRLSGRRENNITGLWVTGKVLEFNVYP